LLLAVEENESAILEALKADLNKHATEAYISEISLVKGEIKFALKNLKKWTKVKKVKTPIIHWPSKSYLYSEPYGVVLIIAPWNYPFQLSFSPLVGAIAAGNCAIVKPSEFAKATSSVVNKLISSTFNKNYITVVEGDHEVSSNLLKERFDYIFFTGSSNVGKIVLEHASKHLTPVTLELGGKSPAIVTSSANVKLAAKRILFSKFLNAGQTCIATDYILVDKRVKSITIGGFRNLERTKIEVKAITALVSLNNYGKTNFLKGIEFAVAFITKGEFEREKMMGLIHSIPLNPSLSNEPFVFEIEFHESKLKEYQFIRYGFSFKWKRNGDSGQRLVDEWLDLRESESTKYTSYLKREELKYRKSKSTTAFRNIILNEYQLALDNLSSIDDLDYLEVIKLIKRFSLSCMENSYQENNSVNSKMFYDLKKSDPNKFDLFREAILTIFDDIVDIDVVKTEFEPKSYKFYSSVVSDWKEQSVPFKLDNESYPNQYR
jgi:hypothetical protein